MIYGWIYKDHQGRCWVHRLSDRFSDEDPCAFMISENEKWFEECYFDIDVTYEDFERIVGAFESNHTCGEL